MSRSSASASAASPCARGEDFGGRERGGAAEAAVEMHVLDPKLVEGEIGKTGIEASLRIALQIPRPWRAAPAHRSTRPLKVTRGMVERVAAVGARRSTGGRRAGRSARFLVWRDSVDIRNRGAPSKSLATPTSVVSGAPRRLERRQGARAGEPHQPLDVGDGLGMGFVGIDGGVRHGGLDASDGLETRQPGGVARSRAAAAALITRPLRPLANASQRHGNLAQFARGAPSGIGRLGGSPFSEHIQSINGFFL